MHLKLHHLEYVTSKIAASEEVGDDRGTHTYGFSIISAWKCNTLRTLPAHSALARTNHAGNVDQKMKTHWSSNPANKQMGIWWARSTTHMFPRFQECKHWNALSIPFALKKPCMCWKKKEWERNIPKYNSYSIVSGFYFLLYISYISPTIFHNHVLNPKKEWKLFFLTEKQVHTRDNYDSNEENDSKEKGISLKCTCD